MMEEELKNNVLTVIKITTEEKVEKMKRLTWAGWVKRNKSEIRQNGGTRLLNCLGQLISSQAMAHLA